MSNSANQLGGKCPYMPYLGRGQMSGGDHVQHFCLISRLSVGIFSYFFQIMNEYDQTFNPNILIGHYDLISWFSDFALYLGTQLVHEQTSFTLCLV